MKNVSSQRRTEALSGWDRFSNSLQAKPIVVALVLVFLTFLVFSPVARFQFLDLDDGLYVADNPHVTSGLTLANLSWAMKETGTFYWHPLAWVSHMIDCQLFGLQSAYHHVVNVLLHALNVALLFALLFTATRALWRSAVVALLFAVHPLNVETVAWVAERKSLLSAFFSFVTIFAYGWYAKKPAIGRYLAVLFAFSCALMSKPMAVTLPILLLLVDFWPLRRIQKIAAMKAWSKLVLEKVPLILLSVGSSLVTIVGQSASMTDVAKLPISMRLGQGVDSYLHYLSKIFFPSNLSPFYPYMPHWIPLAEVVLGLVLLATMTVIVLFRIKERYLVFGWLWFLIALIPVLGVVQVGASVIAERFTYIPAIGIFCLVVWTCSDVVERFKVPNFAPGVVCIAVIAALAVGTLRYLPNWATSVTVFSRAAQVVEPDPVLEDQLADALLRDGNVDGALEHSVRSCALNPEREICHVQIADIIFSQNTPLALQHYEVAAKHTKIPWLKTYCLASAGKARLALGDIDGAERQLTDAQGIDPTIPAVRELSMYIAQSRNSEKH